MKIVVYRSGMRGEQQILTCPECGARMCLKNSRFGKFYGCERWPDCRGTHGAHADGKPLGVPADQRTKHARMRAHKCLDRFWKSGVLTRSETYRLAAAVMNLSGEEMHIGRFTEVLCEELIRRLSRIPTQAGRAALEKLKKKG